MISNELRIGNIFLFQGATGRLFGVNKDCFIQYSQGSDVYNCGIDEIEQIPLTEEILLKCGFNYESKLSDKDCMVYYLHDELCILWAGYLCLDINGSFIPLADTELNHLHQLQNLYFTLTGEELEINF